MKSFRYGTMQNSACLWTIFAWLYVVGTEGLNPPDITFEDKLEAPAGRVKRQAEDPFTISIKEKRETKKCERNREVDEPPGASPNQDGCKTFGEQTSNYDPKVDEKNICDNATLDATFSLANGVSYAFRGAYYWRVVRERVEAGYPQLIRDTWYGLPDNLDAAFNYKNGEIIFFKGAQYWKGSLTKLDQGYPKYISEGFPGIPDNIQGASRWGKKGHIYFFKGDKYWRYEPNLVPPVRNTYPKLIRDVWEGIPDNVDDAVLFDNGVMYFLKGVKYWRFDDDKLKAYQNPKEPQDPYPRLTAIWWFSCKPEP